MIVESTRIPDVKLITPRVFGDDRGFFMETWNAAVFAAAGLDLQCVQAGSVFDVAVDLRRSSPTFGQWVGVELSAVNKQMLWVPPGFAHGFVTLEDGTDFLYKCTELYNPADEHCVLWNDPQIGIEWPLCDMDPILSAKDAVGRLLVDAATYS